MTRLVLLSLVVIGTAFAPAAQAHNADPNYLTTLRGLEPPIPGLHIEVLNRGDRLLVVADGVKQQVIIDGYSNDPYLRVGPGKRIDVNTNSPAYYLNQDRFGTVSAPANVTGKGAPGQLPDAWWFRPVAADCGQHDVDSMTLARARLEERLGRRAFRVARPPHPLDEQHPAEDRHQPEGQDQGL